MSLMMRRRMLLSAYMDTVYNFVASKATGYNGVDFFSNVNGEVRLYTNYWINTHTEYGIRICQQTTAISENKIRIPANATYFKVDVGHCYEPEPVFGSITGYDANGTKSNSLAVGFIAESDWVSVWLAQGNSPLPKTLWDTSEEATDGTLTIDVTQIRGQSLYVYYCVNSAVTSGSNTRSWQWRTFSNPRFE